MSEETYGPRTPAWGALERHIHEPGARTIRSLFQADPVRGVEFCREAEGLFLDLSRQRLDARGLTLLVQLAEQTGVARWIGRMFAGEPINNTESRPALHVALRRPSDRPLVVDGENVMVMVEAERAKMRGLADALHAGELTGYAGEPITDVVNIGIGGSDLGVVMAVEALAPFRKPGLGVHFISNLDGAQAADVLCRVDPGTTVFVICSKTFTTLETLTNARVVRDWLVGHADESAVAAQFVAVSTNHDAMDDFGIAPDRRLAMWDWVGGRYSLSSAAGLTLALAVGTSHFEAFLAGAHAMDEHFRTSPLAQNLPVLLALVGVYNRNFLGAASHAVLPYDYHLHRFPAYLQQLEMESNGKSVRRNGEPVECVTCPVVWGEPGSNAQHSFYQLLHQGTERISADFIAPAVSTVGRQDQQDLAVANCLAQSWALAEGDPAGQSPDPHRHYAGDRPSSLILFERLDPETLGKLVALYEHKVFVQGVIWDVNSFDQWGVELGKRLAFELMPALSSPATGRAVQAGPRETVAIAAALARFRAWRS